MSRLMSHRPGGVALTRPTNHIENRRLECQSQHFLRFTGSPYAGPPTYGGCIDTEEIYARSAKPCGIKSSDSTPAHPKPNGDRLHRSEFPTTGRESHS